MPLASIVGWGGVTAGACTTLLQALLVRRKGTDGVNATTWSLFTLMSAFWLSYGLSVESPEVVVGTILGLPFLLRLLWMLDATERRRGLVKGATAMFVMAWLPAALFGWNVGLLGLGALIIATRMPQLLELVRVDHARGVSSSSWAIGSLSVTLWLAYYVSSSMTAAAVSMALALVTNLMIVTLAVMRHRGSRFLLVRSRELVVA